MEDTTSEAAPLPLGHVNTNNVETSSARWDDLCERCVRIPWEGLMRPETGAVPPDFKIRLGEHFDPKNCRLCSLFAHVYSRIPLGATNIHLMPDVSRNRKYRFQRRLLRGTAESGNSDILWILTDRKPDDKEVLAEYAQSQSECVDFDMIKSWASTCDDEHDENCKPTSTASIKQLKVIDCVERVIVAAPTDCEYVALSYVWGQSKAIQDDETEESDSLPLTILDAEVVTKKLGYRYLWVDRYCIDQADMQDKQVQIRQMGAIYSAAQLTIIASAGDSPEYGLPGIDPMTRSFEWLHEQVGHCYIVALPIPATLAIYNSRWASRAWTYQEGYLSKRRLLLTDRQAVFLCNQDILWDGPDERSEREADSKLPLGLTGDFFPHSAFSETLGMFRCMEYIATYSKRTLSHDVDALDAISGILNTQPHHDGKPVFHISGVPFVAVLHRQPGIWVALNWYHEQPCRRRSNMPSWSSLAWDRRIMWIDFIPRPLVPRDCQIMVRTENQPIDIEQLSEGSHFVAELDGSRGKQILEITAYTVELPPITPSSIQNMVHNEPQLVLALDNDNEAVIQPYWDKLIMDKTTIPLLGLIFTHDLSIESWTQYPQPTVMILELNGNYYERVGLFPKNTTAEGPRTHLRTQTMPDLAEYGNGNIPSSTYVWLQNAAIRRILLG
ncbi:heterokaryon incompatibility protein-domain-containing protein [Lophiotrema nucula]|uniref:Heterokaryon incompatibility protein-domain-containing protein n=1 Tax=Lophiotrema nucula TaxID=690887 RepID=A0A6A5Z8E9_9PLEO|nr:heterokaryon incompatibility protein-domain-containing protein [Lophiotrema nucula]